MTSATGVPVSACFSANAICSSVYLDFFMSQLLARRLQRAGKLTFRLAEKTGSTSMELCRKHGMSSATYYAWKAKFGGLEVSDAKRLRALEEETARLKRLLADTMLDNAGLKDLLSKKW